MNRQIVMSALLATNLALEDSKGFNYSLLIPINFED